MTLTTDTALDPSHVYFVRDNNGDYTVGSYRYSVVSEPVLADISTYYELSIDESLNNYVATHLAVDSEGLWILPDSGGNRVLIATGNGTGYPVAGTYIIGKVNGNDTLFAKFTAGGATMQAENGTQIAHLGYGLGNAQSGTAVAPYYTFGTRASGSAVGNYSVVAGSGATASNYASYAEGVSTTSSGFGAHAEGSQTTASGSYCHAEGWNTEAGGMASHAEGYKTKAQAAWSHSEGQETQANASWSHAQNKGTTAIRSGQTTLGTYNSLDPGGYSHPSRESTYGQYAVIIGNGTSDTARSNALTVDWGGDVCMALDTSATSGTDKEIYDALVSLGWDSDVIV